MNPTPGRQLALQTYDGQDIPNSIDPNVSSRYIAQARNAFHGLLAMVKQLGPPTGRYNCFGLVFASRRTNIPPIGLPEALNIDHLLQRDCYQLISVPQVGDVVIYRGPREIEHAGFICRVDSLALDRSLAAAPQVMVWSMWGGLGEFEHPVLGCPYRDCKVEYWRLRP